MIGVLLGEAVPDDGEVPRSVGGSSGSIQLARYSISLTQLLAPQPAIG